MTSDPLSDILDLVNARCLISGSLVAGGGWARRFEYSGIIKFMAVAEGLTKRYRTGDLALKGISLDVPDGEVMALIAGAATWPMGAPRKAGMPRERT